MKTGPEALDVLDAVARSHRRSPEELRAYRARCLAKLVSHAHDRVPFYRDAWRRSGVRPDDVRGPEDLPALPLVDRRQVQEAGPRRFVDDRLRPEDLVGYRTSGSSGAPLTIRRTLSERKLLQLFRIRALRRLGATAADVVVRVGLPGEASVLTRALHRLGVGGYRYLELDARREPAELAARMAELAPDVVTGYPGALARVADELGEGRRGRLRPRFVLLGGESVTAPARRHVAAGFGAPVREWYGCYEGNLLAWECRSTGLLHVCDDSVVVEVVGEDGSPVAPGERGEVVITPLHLRAMPFVRYRLGDVVTRGPGACPCGAPFGTIREIHGRVLDYFRLPGGRLVHPYDVTNENVKSRPWILQYQIVQEAPTAFRLRVVPAGAPGTSAVASVRRDVAAALGGGASVRVELVDDIPREPSGKYRTAVCLVDVDVGREERGSP